MRNKNGLKPCPFCAKQPKTHSFRNDLWTVVCDCGCQSPRDSKSESGAKRIWNRRRYVNLNWKDVNNKRPGQGQKAMVTDGKHIHMAYWDIDHFYFGQDINVMNIAWCKNKQWVELPELPKFTYEHEIFGK